MLCYKHVITFVFDFFEEKAGENQRKLTPCVGCMITNLNLIANAVHLLHFFIYGGNNCFSLKLHYFLGVMVTFRFSPTLNIVILIDLSIVSGKSVPKADSDTEFGCNWANTNLGYCCLAGQFSHFLLTNAGDDAFGGSATDYCPFISSQITVQPHPRLLQLHLQRLQQDNTHKFTI